MSRKRASLFKEASPPVPAPVEVKPVPPQPVPTATPTPRGRKRGTEAPGRPPSRQGKRIISVYVEPEAAMQLGILAIRESTSVQALMVEAVNDFFAKRGMNRIA
jgi:hypothetical protein